MKAYERPHWLKCEGVYIQLLDGSYWANDYRVGLFGDASVALAYLQTHWTNYDDDTRLLIAGVMFLVRADGLYYMSERQGWQKYEGVQP